ncbi:MAG: CRISPR-associated protein Csm2 [Bacteroidales bacterium]|jgi:CRISPR type III-A-associated protein Csm2|nr:CRISPR-associated protein Csm2 [Bacteroidales bacterium]MDN5330555.1 CRISPR-associated protein Csm2 [Bacteroidales bacterium]NPV36978.1 type III-A CRISPR-associated protein Csm2 [Bacteroidales bacterium]
MPINQEWIQNGINNDAINWANELGNRLSTPAGPKKALTSSQIRKFFGELKRIQVDPILYQSDIPMLKAKLAYAVGRAANRNGNQVNYESRIIDFYNEIIVGLDYLRNDEQFLKDDFINFVKLIEAVVAFHKYYGGK